MTAATIAIRNVDMPLETASKAIDLNLAGLVEVGPSDRKRDRLSFTDELVRIFSIRYFNTPAGERCRQDLEYERRFGFSHA